MNEYDQLADFIGRTGIYHPEPPARPTEPPDLRFYTGRENYPPVLTEDDGADGLGCADCGEHLNDGCHTVCLGCATKREETEEALLHRLWQISHCLDEAIKLAENIDEPDSLLDRVIFARLKYSLGTAQSHIPEVLEQQAATPPEVKV